MRRSQTSAEWEGRNFWARTQHRRIMSRTTELFSNAPFVNEFWQFLILLSDSSSWHSSNWVLVYESSIKLPAIDMLCDFRTAASRGWLEAWISSFSRLQTTQPCFRVWGPRGESITRTFAGVSHMGSSDKAGGSSQNPLGMKVLSQHEAWLIQSSSWVKCAWKPTHFLLSNYTVFFFFFLDP